MRKTFQVLGDNVIGKDSGMVRAGIAIAALIVTVSGAIFGVAGTLRAQEGPAAELVLENPRIARFFAPASGALFAQASASVVTPSSESLLRSNDGGTTWRAIDLPTAPADQDGRRAIAVDPLDHTILYATGLDGLYKSDDDAASWRPILPTSGAQARLSISPADTRVVYVTLTLGFGAAAPTRIVRSRDGGESWDEILAMPCGGAWVFPDPSDAARVSAALECGETMPAALYASEDQGVTWSPFGEWPKTDPALGVRVSGPILRGGQGGGSGPLYAAFLEHSLETGIPLYRTDDRGATWNTLIVGPREETPPSSPKWQGGKFWAYVNALALDPADPARLYVGLAGAARPLRTSADGGATWSEIALPCAGPPCSRKSITALALGIDGQNLYVATASGGSSDGSEGIYRLRLPAP